MIAAALARSAASSSRQLVARAASGATAASSARAPFAAARLAAARLSPPAFVSVRTYASGGGPSVEDIEKRIRDVLTSFEKVKAAAITPTASFTSDLGLDSLDAVEVVMAIEEEFNIEIPDEEADNITTVQQAIDYVSHAPEAI